MQCAVACLAVQLVVMTKSTTVWLSSRLVGCFTREQVSLRGDVCVELTQKLLELVGQKQQRQSLVLRRNRPDCKKGGVVRGGTLKNSSSWRYIQSMRLD